MRFWAAAEVTIIMQVSGICTAGMLYSMVPVPAPYQGRRLPPCQHTTSHVNCLRSFVNFISTYCSSRCIRCSWFKLSQSNWENTTWTAELSWVCCGIAEVGYPFNTLGTHRRRRWWYWRANWMIWCQDEGIFAILLNQDDEFRRIKIML